MLRTGGAEGNARLTAVIAAVLIVLLAIEGATIPFLHSLLNVHVFVGMLLLVPVGLKLGSIGYRFVRYYSGSRPYVDKGPPGLLMRALVAPILVVSTLTLLGSGIALVTISPHHGTVLLLHRASFLVWFGAMSIHVLAYTPRATRYAAGELRHRIDGSGLRLGIVLAGITVGLVVGLTTVHLATHWHGDHRHGFDDGRIRSAAAPPVA